MKQDPKQISTRLLETGWQSWSTGYFDRRFRLPLYNYPPNSISRPGFVADLQVEKLKEPIKGWCSWYCYGPDVNEELVLRQADWFKKSDLTEFQHILLDDGWVSHWGDWQIPDYKKFPSGLKVLAQKIQQKGLKPGIWLAPFLVSPNSKLVHNHPQWLVRRAGKPLEGLRVTPFDKYLPYRKYILDVTQQSVTSYIDEVLDFLLLKCGFQFIKLDFLYGIYNNPKLTTSESDEYLRSFLKKIKHRYQQVYTIACGCPLLPAVGVVDSMRIGPDILPPFARSIPLISQLMNRYCYEKIMHNIASRSWTKKYWNLDYDSFVCRAGTGISENKLFAQCMLLKQSNGNIFLGDDMTKLTKDRLHKFVQSFVE